MHKLAQMNWVRLIASPEKTVKLPTGLQDWLDFKKKELMQIQYIKNRYPKIPFHFKPVPNR